mgnify:CR=1 FL=1
MWRRHELVEGKVAINRNTNDGDMRKLFIKSDKTGH